MVFSDDRREQEERTFWFQDGVHWPMTMTPWDATFDEYAIAALSQYNTRHYLIPPALGIDYRILNRPCEKNKFGAGAAFPVQWIESGFARYSPQKEALLRPSGPRRARSPTSGP